MEDKNYMTVKERLFSKPRTSSSEDMLDKFAVKELIGFERFCRDNCLWEAMHTCFADDSTVNVSWYKGSGYGFVEASRNMQTKAPHKLNNTLVWLNGVRAAAVTMASIQTREEIKNREYDLTSYVRFLYTAEKRAGEWEIISMDCIYEKDCLVPAVPEVLNGEEKPEGIRASYGNLSLILGGAGHTIAADLPGEDRPETIDRLLEDKMKWFCS